MGKNGVLEPFTVHAGLTWSVSIFNNLSVCIK